jgi:hypothetical protein
MQQQYNDSGDGTFLPAVQNLRQWAMSRWLTMNDENECASVFASHGDDSSGGDRPITEFNERLLFSINEKGV